MKASNLKKIVIGRKKRVGRGYGSGTGGHTSTRGQKGQTSRSGYHPKRGFEGGQNPISKRLPILRKATRVYNSKNGDSLRISILLEKGVYDITKEALSAIVGHENVKLVGDTDYSKFDMKKVNVAAEIKISASLKAVIEKAGGKVN